MNRRQLLAAETFHYSYDNYENHLGINNIRFDKLMPNDVDILEKSERENWNIEELAAALKLDVENVEFIKTSFENAKEIVNAPNPAESFRVAVRHSIEFAIKEGLNNPEDIEKLVVQICYRTADLSYLLKQERSKLSDYSDLLRREPDVEYCD